MSIQTLTNGWVQLNWRITWQLFKNIFFQKWHHFQHHLIILPELSHQETETIIFRLCFVYDNVVRIYLKLIFVFSIVKLQY